MHDASKIDGDVHVLKSSGEEFITPLFKHKRERVPKGDLFYGHRGTDHDNALEALAWLGKRDTDSDDYQVTEETTAVFLIALGNTHTSENFNRDLCEETIRLIRETSPVIKVRYLDVIHCA